MTVASRTAPAAPRDAPAEALAAYHRDDMGACTRCALSATRTTVVVGAGDPAAELMLVGDAPGYRDDRSGRPFGGPAGEELDRLLAGIGMHRDDVFLATVLRCRPPGNREGSAAELAACERHLFREVALVRPLVVAALGTVAVRMLAGGGESVTGVHGRDRPARLAGVEVTLVPLHHPGGARDDARVRAALEADFARLPRLLDAARGHASIPRPPAPVPAAPVPAPPEPVPAAAPAPVLEQLGLF